MSNPKYSVGQIVQGIYKQRRVEILGVNGHYRGKHRDRTYHYNVRCVEHGEEYIASQNRLTKFDAGKGGPGCPKCNLEPVTFKDKRYIPPKISKRVMRIADGAWVRKAS